MQRLLQQQHVDVLVLSETHAQPGQDLALPGMTLASRADRPTKGGGAAIFIQKEVSYHNIPVSSAPGVQACKLSVTKQGRSFVILGGYVAPINSEHAPSSSALADWLDATLPGADVFIGDLNARLGHPHLGVGICDRGELLAESMDEHSLSIIPSPNPTRIGPTGATVPDLCFVHDSIADTTTLTTGLWGGSDHCPLVCHVSFAPRAPEAKTLPRWRLKHARWEEFSRDVDSRLANYDPTIMPATELFEVLHYHLLAAGRSNVPFGRQRPNAKPWWNDQLTTLQSHIQQLSNTLQQTPPSLQPPLVQQLATLRDSFRHQCKTAKLLYWEGACSQATAADLFHLYKRLRKDPKTVTTAPHDLLLDAGSDKWACTANDRATTLAHHFAQLNGIPEEERPTHQRERQECLKALRPIRSTSTSSTSTSSSTATTSQHDHHDDYNIDQCGFPPPSPPFPSVLHLRYRAGTDHTATTSSPRSRQPPSRVPTTCWST